MREDESVLSNTQLVHGLLEILSNCDFYIQSMSSAENSAHNMCSSILIAKCSIWTIQTISNCSARERTPFDNLDLKAFTGT